MAQIKVQIYQPATGKSADVQLPDDAQIVRLLPRLAERLKIEAPASGATQYKLSYKWPNPPDPFDLKDDDTLAGKGVKEGSRLVLTHEFNAG